MIWKFKDAPEISKSILYTYENTLIHVWKFFGMRRIHSIRGSHVIDKENTRDCHLMNPRYYGWFLFYVRRVHSPRREVKPTAKNDIRTISLPSEANQSGSCVMWNHHPCVFFRNLNSATIDNFNFYI